MGAVWGLTIGLALALILRNRRGAQGQLPSPVTINNFSDGVTRQLPLPITQVANQQTAATTRPPKFDTFTLSSDPSSPSRVATAASDRHWRVQLHNVGPPGSFAIVDDDSVMTYPASQGITIPAGGDHVVKLQPRSALFAFGSVPGVILSVSSTEEIA